MTKLEYTFKNDALFKTIFVKYPHLLQKLVAVILDVDCESIQQFRITNPEMPPESLGDKFCRLDINMIVDGRHINLEVQNHNEGDYPERSLFHWARLYSTSLPAGKGFSELPRTIVISILSFKLFDCKEYRSEFMALETTRHTPLTDKMQLHYFELPKLPTNELTTDNLLKLWLALFKAETKEDLEKIKELEVPIMNQAIEAYHTITAESEFRERERLWAKARHDEAQAIYNAEKRGAAAEREKWQAEVERLHQELAELRDKHV
jgi:predicted transposase/invertase (TIGR01784 family)